MRIISSAIALCWLSALTHAIWSTGQKSISIIKSWVLIFLKFFERKFIVISSQKEQSVSRCTLSRTKHFCWRFLLSLFHPFIFLYSGHLPDGNNFRSNLLILSYNDTHRVHHSTTPLCTMWYVVYLKTILFNKIACCTDLFGSHILYIHIISTDRKSVV